MRLAIISDTHGIIDSDFESNLSYCDQVLHAGDIGTLDLFKKLEGIKPIYAVYGNIDGHELRCFIPRKQIFILEGVKFYMTHIGGYPGKYAKGVKDDLLQYRPDVFVSGHSHILKIMPDKQLNLLHINPGATGNYGFHKVKTMVVVEIVESKIIDIKVIEGAKRNVI